MHPFTFSGDWQFDLKLEDLARIGRDTWFNSPNVEGKQKRHEGYVTVKIADERNYDPDPSPAQLNTLTFIINNQHEIVAALYNAFLTVINPKYVEACGDESWIPPMKSPEDLGLLAGLHGIAILVEQKEGAAFWEMSFEYAGDHEHGLAVVFHGLQLIEYSGIGDMGYEKVYTALGIEADKRIDANIAQRDFGANMVHKPLPKYAKCKPWQLNTTEDFFRDLMRKRDLQGLIHEIESNCWDINFRFPSNEKNLVDIAAYHNNVEVIQYLINRGVDFSQSMPECTDYYIKKEAIRCLVGYGATVDQFNGWKVTPLRDAIVGYLRAMLRVQDNGKEDQRYKNAMTEMTEYKDKIEFYLQMGANRFRLNDKGDDYVALIRSQWSEDFIQKRNLIEAVEEVFSFNA